MVYVTRPSKKAELAPRLREEFAAVKGVSQVVEPSDFAKYGFPAPNERMADLVLFAEDRFAFDVCDEGRGCLRRSRRVDTGRAWLRKLGPGDECDLRRLWCRESSAE